jgi:hypothetical protein
MRLSPRSGYTLLAGAVWTAVLLAVVPTTAGPAPLFRRLGPGLADFASGGVTQWRRRVVRLLWPTAKLA